MEFILRDERKDGIIVKTMPVIVHYNFEPKFETGISLDKGNSWIIVDRLSNSHYAFTSHARYLRMDRENLLNSRAIRTVRSNNIIWKTDRAWIENI